MNKKNQNNKNIFQMNKNIVQTEKIIVNKQKKICSNEHKNCSNELKFVKMNKKIVKIKLWKNIKLHVVPRAVVNTNNIVQMNNILNGSNSSRIASLTAL